MHPSRAIRGRHSQLLAGRRIIVGISGSIAAIEVPRVIRELIRHGADVRAVMSSEASRLVTTEAITFASGHPPILQLTGDVEHVSLLGPGEDQADLLLIAPATANTISKIALGIDDTPVTSFASIALGGGVPILLAPAMHAQMGTNPAIRANLERLRSWGVGIIGPQRAEDEEKLATPEEVAAAVLHRLGRPPWAGRRVVVIGGASRESVDSIRSITNESSGAMAIALASQAHFRGADVILWAGALSVSTPSFFEVRSWRSVRDLHTLLRKEESALRSTDVVLVPAAISDFTLESRPGKISSREHETLTLHLTRAPKVLGELRRFAGPKAWLVGFKLAARLSTEALAEEASQLLRENRLDWVVANDRSAMGSQDTNLLLVTRDGRRHWLHGPKHEVAGKLLDDLGRELAEVSGDREGRPTTGSGSSSRRKRSSRRPKNRARAASR